MTAVRSLHTRHPSGRLREYSTDWLMTEQEVKKRPFGVLAPAAPTTPTPTLITTAAPLWG